MFCSSTVRIRHPVHKIDGPPPTPRYASDSRVVMNGNSTIQQKLSIRKQPGARSRAAAEPWICRGVLQASTACVEEGLHMCTSLLHRQAARPERAEATIMQLPHRGNLRCSAISLLPTHLPRRCALAHRYRGAHSTVGPLLCPPMRLEGGELLYLPGGLKRPSGDRRPEHLSFRTKDAEKA